jgi:hypothetical protein
MLEIEDDLEDVERFGRYIRAYLKRAHRDG